MQEGALRATSNEQELIAKCIQHSYLEEFHQPSNVAGLDLPKHASTRAILRCQVGNPSLNIETVVLYKNASAVSAGVRSNTSTDLKTPSLLFEVLVAWIPGDFHEERFHLLTTGIREYHTRTTIITNIPQAQVQAR